MDDSVQLQLDLFSGVATSRDSTGYPMQLPRGCLTTYQVSTSTHYVYQVRTRIILWSINWST